MAVLKEAAHQLQDSVPPNTPSRRAEHGHASRFVNMLGRVPDGGEGGARGGDWRSPDHAPASATSRQREGTRTGGRCGSGGTLMFGLIPQIRRVLGTVTVRSPYSQASRFEAQALSVFFKVVIVSRNTPKYLRMKLYDVWNLLQISQGSGWERGVGGGTEASSLGTRWELPNTDDGDMQKFSTIKSLKVNK